MIRLFSIILFLIISTYINGQKYNYQHYDLTSGLAGLTIYKIVQDHDGFLWFATETGLSRFDGTTFKNFSTADGLPDNEIINLYVDNQNRVWILPFAHSICYYKDGKIHTQQNDTLLAKMKFTSNPVLIMQDKTGNILITENTSFHILTRNNLVVFKNTIDGFKFINMGLGINEEGNIVYPIIEKVESGMPNWRLFQLKNAVLQNVKTESFEEHNFAFSTTFLSTTSVLITQRYYQLHILSKQYKYSKRVRIPKDLISISSLTDTSFTLNCNNGVFVFDLHKGGICDTFLRNKATLCSFKDSEGNLWFGTNGHGIFRLVEKSIVNYDFLYHSNTLPVYSLCKTNNKLYVGTSQALIWEIGSNGKIIKNKKISDEAMDARVTGILSYDDKLIVGSGSATSLKYYFKGKEYILLLAASVKKLTLVQNELLIATNSDVYALNMDSLSYYAFAPIAKELESVYSKYHFLSTISNASHIWISKRSTCAYKCDSTYYIGSLNGLYKVSNTRQETYLGSTDSLLASRISAIVQDSEILWIATYGNGIVGYDYKKENVVAHISEKEGLISNMCRDIAIQSNTLWVGTNKGLNAILLNKRKQVSDIKAYTAKNGLNNDIVNCLLVNKDSIYIGTPYGLVVFVPALIDNYSIANLKVNSIVSSKHKWLDRPSDIQLEAGDNRFYVDYSCISFKSQKNITYNFRLIGLDTQWNTTKETFLDYPSLPPGDYKLELYAVNAFGKRSNDVVITFTIEKFFYQQLWFILLVAGIILAIGWLLVLKRIRKIKRTEHEKLTTQKRLSELEQMAFRAQMNPHFIFNCLNSIQQYIFSKNVLDANHFITAFSSLIRQTMELSAKKLISLEEEIKYLSTYLKLEHTRFDGNFDYNIAVAAQLIPETIYLPSLILQPFLENSIRHGIRNLKERKGKICVQFFEQDNRLFCVIEDNGIGRKASQKLRTLNKIEHQSKGLSLIEKRIEVLNNENEQQIILNIEDVFPDEEYSGTKVTLQIPL